MLSGTNERRGTLALTRSYFPQSQDKVTLKHPDLALL